MTGNPVSTAMRNAIVEWLTAQRTVALRVEGTEILALKAHQRVFKKVAAGDPEGAGRAMIEHLEEINALYRRAMQGAGTARHQAPAGSVHARETWISGLTRRHRRRGD